LCTLSSATSERAANLQPNLPFFPPFLLWEAKKGPKVGQKWSQKVELPNFRRGKRRRKWREASAKWLSKRERDSPHTVQDCLWAVWEMLGRASNSLGLLFGAFQPKELSQPKKLSAGPTRESKYPIPSAGGVLLSAACRVQLASSSKAQIIDKHWAQVGERVSLV